MKKWIYDTLTDPTDVQLNNAGTKGWEVYATDGRVYKVRKEIK